MKRREEARRLAILVLEPPVEEFGLLEFKSFDRIVEAGYRGAIGRWGRICNWKTYRASS